MPTARILVVEDQGIIASDIKKTLEGLGYEVPATASSGVEACRKAELFRPDLVLMDIVLKGDIDGVETANRLRQQLDIPVIYLTAYSDDSTLGRAAVTAPFGYILKPFEERDLQTAISVALHKHRIECELRESEERYRRLAESETRERQMAEALIDAAAALNSTLNLDEVLDRILAVVGRVLPHESANVMLLEGDVAYVVRAQGYNLAPEDLRALRFRVSEMFGLRRMCSERTGLVIADILQEPGWHHFEGLHPLRSYAGAPIFAKGEIIGFLNLNAATPGFFAPTDVDRLRAFADQAGLAIENARLHALALSANAQLQAALADRDQMAQNISHELRAPLSQIKGFADLLLEGLGGDLTAEQHSYLEVISRRSQDLARLVEGLLTLQTFDPASLRPEPIDSELLLADLASEWQTVAGSRVQIDTPTLAAAPVVLADASCLREALDQLMSNALKFTPEGGRIRLDATRANGRAWLIISDTGRGIPHDQLERVFERFYQVRGNGSGRQSGVGIGLSIVRQIVDGHGGRIWAESPGRLNCGTSFIVELPLVAVSGPAAASAEPERHL